MSGLPQLTDAQRAARGTAKPSRAIGPVIDFPKTTNPPDPPEWLPEEGKALWHDVVPHLHSQRVLATADLQALAHLCELNADIIDGYKRRVRPTAAELGQLRLYFVEFGMTPASRTRVRLSGEKDQGNKFKRNGAKPGA